MGSSMQLPELGSLEGAFALFAVSALALGVSVSAPAAQVGQDEADVLTWENHITVKHNGEVVAEFHNLLTDQGEDFIRDKISALNTTGDFVASDPAKNASFIAVGNGTTPLTKTDTILPGEVTDSNSGLQRAQGSTTAYQAGNFSVSVTFTANEDIGVVNRTSLNWNSSGPSIVSGGAFGTEANILNGDQLTVTHNISIQ